MKTRFHKYHALHNDFIVVEKTAVRGRGKELTQFARAICCRQTGVGADGLLVIASPASETPEITVVNADGSVAEMSGNGLRIVGLYLHDTLRRRKRFVLAMGGRTNKVAVGNQTSHGVMVTGELPAPSFESGALPMKSPHLHHINHPIKVGTVSLPVTCLSVGNPHCVLFVADFDFDWRQIGREIENHPMFPKRTNVEFVRVITKRRIEVRFWERGVGETGSSGTGSSAAVCAGAINGLLERSCRVKTTSGELNVSWLADDGGINLEGPVTRVCEGVYFHP